MSRKRGIVFCPHFENLDGDAYIPHVQLRKEQMQNFCLYWDYIVQPISGQLPRWKRTVDELVLEEAGILLKDYQDTPFSRNLFTKESTYSLKSEGAKNWVNTFLDFQAQSLKKSAVNKPDVIWVPQQSYREFVARTTDAIDEHCVQVALYNKLPVPAENISLKKIVAFKYDHSDMLNEFRNAMDQVTLQVSLPSGFSETALNLAISDLEKVTNEITALSRSRFGRSIKFTDLRVNIGSQSLATLFSEFVKGASLSGSASLSPLVAIFGGLACSAASMVQLKPIKSKKLKVIPAEQLEFSYLTEAITKGIARHI
ncbi:DUF6236 family protein [Vibrio sp. 378]|uniref:DUF6236 family protein n=1 Tax=Vibrio sp. 378 TaxID=3074603 RepID=UPI0021CF9453|nr:DUF6236 family protein [Vibrio sp. 378]EKK7179025.1 hypothetical protein [Vibrio alginolyticus]MDW2147018.1 DUF6236 family protein [Vibrio sp. 378]